MGLGRFWTHHNAGTVASVVVWVMNRDYLKGYST